MFAFEYENHTKYLTESIHGLFKRNVLVDCTVIAEHQFIHGHKVILAACSPYFELLFSQKQDTKPVVLKDVKFQDLKSLVDFMYFGEVYIPAEQLNSFVETAEALQVKGLTNLYKQENNVECSDDSEVNVRNKCEKREWNFCEKTFQIKRERESEFSTSGTSEIEECAELNYNADGCNEDSVRELKLTFNRYAVIENSKDDYQNPDNNSTGGHLMTQDVAESGSFLGALKMEYEDICSAVSLLPSIKEENESFIMQDDSNRSNVSNWNVVDHCPVDINTVVKGEIEIEETKLNFHENHEVTNLSEITSNDALPSTSQDSLNHSTAICVISGADSYKDFNVNPENITSEFISTSPKLCGFQEGRGSCDDNVIVGLENVHLNERSSNSFGQDGESSSNDSGPKLYLPDNTISFRNVENVGAKLCDNSEDQTGVLEDTAIVAGDGTGLKKNQSLTLPRGNPIFTPLNPYLSNVSRKAPYQCSHCSKGFSDNNNLKTHMHVHRKEHQFECKLCLKRFFDSSKLERHLTVHAAGRKFKCTICSKRFTKSSHLKEHLMTHSGEKNFECTICGKTFARSSVLKQHLLTHSGEKNFECTTCLKRFAQSGHLKEHLLTHSSEKNYECSICLKIFAGYGDLKIHLLTHKGEKNYKCDLCCKSFTQSGHLKRHVLTHNGDKNYKCTICPKRFSRSGDLKSHLLRHSGEKKYECTLCPKRFAVSGDLKKHLLTHSGEKNYECILCNNRFTQKDHLKQHILTHSGEKNYECTICQKRFARSSDLKKHLLTHSREQNYECTVCFRRFTQSGHLKQHVLTHGGEKNYVCFICAKRFARSGDLNRHLSTHSGEKEMYCAYCPKVFMLKERLIDHLRVHD